MPRSYAKKEKTAINPNAYVDEHLNFPLQQGVIITYARQSKEEYYGNVSTEIQTKHMLEHARGLCVAPDKQVVFIDENLQEDGSIKSISGTWGADKRKGLAALYEAIANGVNGQRVALVLAFAEDRMFRDDSAIEYNNYIQIAHKYKVQTKMFQSGKIYNFANQWDKKQFRDKCEWAADELTTKILGRMLGAREYMTTMGQYSGLGSLPLGLVRGEGKLDEEGKPNKYYRKPVPLEPHASKIKELFEAYYENGSPRTVYNELVKDRYVFTPLPEGTPDFYSSTFTSEGARLSYTGLISILTNPMYIGWWYDSVNGRWLKDNHPAIVKPDVFWYAFNRLSTTNLDGTPNHGRVRVQAQREGKIEAKGGILEGHIYHRDSAVKVYCTVRKGIKHYDLVDSKGYGEKSAFMSIRCAEIDGVVLKLLKQKLAQDGRLQEFKKYEEELAKKRKDRITARAVTLAALEAQMTDLKGRIKRVKTLDLIESLDADYAELAAEKKRLLEEPEETNGKGKNGKGKGRRYDYFTLLERLGPQLGALKDDEHKIFIKATCDIYLEALSPRFYLLSIHWQVWGQEVYIMERENRGAVKFTTEEDDLIRQLYNTVYSPDDITKRLPTRIWGAIKNRAFALGVANRPRLGDVIDKRIWKFSQEEIAILDQYGVKELNGYAEVTKDITPS
ncbi:hypothetical protein KSC_066170 [Ktedonobacter sp. SOSP1-52]|uniref:recombinase family protein n=1 Tax=Ktedonobacter sp. SOSP1-52 TaxID=2778366 RepID=UPI0019167B38|nr:recombinase family protein [Ktedonobacter sp. SOSP1-52]GHO67725.1 hypothetical protein KSC_066170 [Ktedonobacter sp. SOSP1-52]